MLPPCRRSRPLVDKESRIIAYLRLTEDAARELETVCAELKFKPEQAGGRRGAFSSVSAGISFGGGQQVRASMSVLFQKLFAMVCFFRIASFTNGLFQMWNPAVHALYALTHDYNAALRRNFARHFSTFPHIDALNLAWGWCAITALGFFDPDLGGHLVLWDLKLIICFPPGSTILIPSAILRHSNVRIGTTETRHSFTQYTAAGLFRWVDNSFKSDLTVTEETRYDLEAQAQRADAWHTRWFDGINSFKRWASRRS
ncbi:hypothetical protein B0H13DRAFT_2243450 [Mycena leptocephala]|nr:hypothetical protein B0H13DRAFT_2243450 [Mycena leptocephala]